MARVEFNSATDMTALPTSCNFGLIDDHGDLSIFMSIHRAVVDSTYLYGSFSGFDSADLAGTITGLDIDYFGSGAVLDIRVFDASLDMPNFYLTSVILAGNDRRLLTDLMQGNDQVEGSDGNDLILGGAGADRINGNDGIDDLSGEKGKDQLDGGAGDDVLRGGAGNDKLNGGALGDSLWGGTGADMFIYSAGSDSDPDSGFVDAIEDFHRKTGDKIDLSKIDTDSTANGDQGFTFIGTSDFSSQKGQLRYEVRTNDVVFYADIDGNGSADLAVIVAGPASLKETDFIL